MSIILNLAIQVLLSYSCVREAISRRTQCLLECSKEEEFSIATCMAAGSTLGYNFSDFSDKDDQSFSIVDPGSFNQPNTRKQATPTND